MQYIVIDANESLEILVLARLVDKTGASLATTGAGVVSL